MALNTSKGKTPARASAAGGPSGSRTSLAQQGIEDTRMDHSDNEDERQNRAQIQAQAAEM